MTSAAENRLRGEAPAADGIETGELVLKLYGRCGMVYGEGARRSAGRQAAGMTAAERKMEA